MAISCSDTTDMLDIVCIEFQHPFHTIIPCPNNGRHNVGLALVVTLHLFLLDRKANQGQEQHIEANLRLLFALLT